MKAYLAGLISGCVIDKCIGWRKQVIDHFRNWKGSGKPYEDLVFLDPTNGEADVSADGLHSNLPPKTILDKDYMAVVNSDIMIVNTDTFGSDRPLTGTIFELAFAWEHHIPIIMITKDRYYREHPFVIGVVSWFFDSVEEMLDAKAIQLFYKALKTPQIEDKRIVEE